MCKNSICFALIFVCFLLIVVLFMHISKCPVEGKKIAKGVPAYLTSISLLKKNHIYQRNTKCVIPKEEY